MKKIKCVFFVISLTLIGAMASAQATDSVKTKSGFFSKVNLSKIQMPKLHLPKVNLFKKGTTVKKDTVVAIQTKKEKATPVEKQIEVKPQDTAAKKSFFSKLNLSKLNVFKKDTTKSNVIAVAPLVTEKKVEVAKRPVVIADVEKVVKVNVPAAYAVPEKKAEAFVEKPIVDTTVLVKTKDTTTKKTNWFSKISAFKKSNVNTDSAKVATPVVEKPVVATTVIVKTKDTATKKTSWFSKISASKKNGLNTDSAKVAAPVIEKAKDTTVNKTSWISKISFSKKTKINNDSAQVKIKKAAKVKEVAVAKVDDTTSLYKTMQQKFLQYTATTTLSLLSGANFSKQTIDAGGYNSNFNYAFSDINEDVYKTGYFGGIRLDGQFKKKHEYSLGFSLAKVASGAKYSSSTKLTPVVGSFSPFKADDHFFVMSLAAHYKKLIPYGDLKKFKFYLVGGPSIDARLSNTSLDNQVSNAYKRIIIKGDLGLEFNNRSLYTLFFHYQHNIGSLTKQPIKTNMNTFQLGIMVKATDLL
jgi:hypothetical protein